MTSFELLRFSKKYFSDDLEGVEMAVALDEKDQRLYTAANYSGLGFTGIKF